MFVLFKILNFIMSSIIIIMHKWNKYFIIDMLVFTIKSVSLVFKWICHISFDSIVRLINSRLKYSIGFNFLFYLIPPCNFIFGFGPLNGWLDICFDTSSLFAMSHAIKPRLSYHIYVCAIDLAEVEMSYIVRFFGEKPCVIYCSLNLNLQWNEPNTKKINSFLLGKFVPLVFQMLTWKFIFQVLTKLNTPSVNVTEKLNCRTS
jgi:hypothetical protein